jgi:hypothetical protein
MFKDRDLAIHVRETCLAINTLVERSACVVQQSKSCTEAERNAYKSKLAKIVAFNFYEILQDLFEAHLDLVPEEVDKIDPSVIAELRRKEAEEMEDEE